MNNQFNNAPGDARPFEQAGKRVFEQIKPLFKEIDPDIIVEFETPYKILIYYKYDTEPPRAEHRESVSVLEKKSDNELRPMLKEMKKVLMDDYNEKELMAAADDLLKLVQKKKKNPEK